MFDIDKVVQVRVALMGRGLSVLLREEDRLLDIGLVVALEDKSSGARVFDRVTVIEAVFDDADFSKTVDFLVDEIYQEVLRYARPLKKDKSISLDENLLDEGFQDFLKKGENRESFLDENGQPVLKSKVSDMLWLMNSVAVSENLIDRDRRNRPDFNASRMSHLSIRDKNRRRK